MNNLYKVLFTQKQSTAFIGLSIGSVTQNKIKNNCFVLNKKESHITYFVGWFVKTPLVTVWRTGGCCNSPGKKCAPKTVLEINGEEELGNKGHQLATFITQQRNDHEHTISHSLFS